MLVYNSKILNYNSQYDIYITFMKVAQVEKTKRLNEEELQDLRRKIHEQSLVLNDIVIFNNDFKTNIFYGSMLIKVYCFYLTGNENEIFAEIGRRKEHGTV